MNKYKKLIALILGALTSLAFAPTYYVFLLPLTFSFLLYQIYKSNCYKKSFLIGWSFGFGYFFSGLYWISYALLVDKSFTWLIPIAAIFIPLILGLYIGLVSLFAHLFKKKHPVKFAISFVSIWTLCEIVRTKILTGFPWLSTGYSMSFFNPFLQSASLWGVFGITFIITLFSSSLFVFYTSRKKTFVIYSVITALILIVNLSYGYVKLSNQNTVFSNKSALVVQPNIPQETKWNIEYRIQNLNKIMSLSYTKEKPDYIIWPEAAVPFSLEKQKIRNYIKRIIPIDAKLITGGTRFTVYPHVQYWNSLFLINHNGDIEGHYDKIHLVPFGEYVPLKKIIPIKKVTEGIVDYSFGNNENTIIKIANTDTSLRPLICYESFFPEEILSRNQKPDMLINITNDAWYRNSPGPYQHFDITKLRAIEYGIPLIRSANTGISAIISPNGEILQQLHLNKTGAIQGSIPKKNEVETFYHLYGNYPLIVMLLFLIFMTLL